MTAPFKLSPTDQAALRREPFLARHALLAIWLGWSAVLVMAQLHAIPALRASDPDDFMRLLEVRDWLGGQGWFDVSQHRMNPPQGADMHWSRLADLPLAAMLWTARLVLPEPAASAMAMTMVPLLQMLLAMALVARLARALGGPRGFDLMTVAVLPLFPTLVTNFLPLRVDHHGWQALLALAALLALRRHDARGAAWAGLLVAAWLTISLEGLPLAVTLSGVLGLRYLHRREMALTPFLAALALAAFMLLLATRGVVALPVAHVDALTWPHIAGFAAGAAVAGLVPRLPGQRRFVGRLAGLVLVGTAGAAPLLMGLGGAALDPFHRLDPLVRRMWLEHVAEGMPVLAQDPATMAMLLYTPLVVLAGWAAVRHDRPGTRPRDWDEIALFALAACLLSLAVMRVALLAQLVTVPFSAVLLTRRLPLARALRAAPTRMLATLACLMLLTPLGASFAGHSFERMVTPVPAITPGATATNDGTCDLARLNALPPAQLFTPLDIGPEVLVRTPHSVVAGSYHRNSAAMRDVIEAFSGDPTRAEALVRGHHARWLVFCADDQELAIDAARRPDSLINALRHGRLPGWLAPVAGFGGGLRVYAIRPLLRPA